MTTTLTGNQFRKLKAVQQRRMYRTLRRQDLLGVGRAQVCVAGMDDLERKGLAARDADGWWHLTPAGELAVTEYEANAPAIFPVTTRAA